MSGISIANVPTGSKLMMVGDWFRKPGKGWFVTCYFVDTNNQTFRKGVPIDLLPALTTGTTYPRTSTENKAKGYTGTFRLPEMVDWQTYFYVDLPIQLKRLHDVSDQIEDQLLFKLDDIDSTYWLPFTELARMLFFQSAEVTRAAVYEGNTWQIAKASESHWIGSVEFSSNVPVSYLNSIQFRKFFAWILFNDEAQNSFSSIFTYLNREAATVGNSERWTFNFAPPDLSGVELSWVGYAEAIGEEDKRRHCYIREIRSLAGLPAPLVESVMFSHPDDQLVIESDKDNEEDSKPPKPRPPKNKPDTIDPDNPTEHKKKRYLLKITSTGFHFDTEIDLRRSPRQVNALPKGEKPDLEEEQPDDSDIGVTEGEKGGKNRRGDINNLEDKEPLEAPEKLAVFQDMLSDLSKSHGWDISSEIGEVPKMRCRSAHMIDGRARKYCFATVIRDTTTTIYVLEIELTDKESLSTLFFRTKSLELARNNILEELMTSNASLNHKAMQWKRKMISENTISRFYLEHPDQKVLSDTEALESWVARAADRISSL